MRFIYDGPEATTVVTMAFAARFGVECELWEKLVVDVDVRRLPGSAVRYIRVRVLEGYFGGGPGPDRDDAIVRQGPLGLSGEVRLLRRRLSLYWRLPQFEIDRRLAERG